MFKHTQIKTCEVENILKEVQVFFVIINNLADV